VGTSEKMEDVGLGESFEGVLGAARARQDWAWETIYRDLAPVVLGYLRAQGVANPDDLSGEVFLQVVRDIQTFEGGEREFRGWVFAIAHNRLIDERRSLKRRPANVFTGEEIEDGEVARSAEEDALAKISEKRARQLLARLSDDQQSVLLLRILGDLTIAQVAAALGRTPGAVKALQRRGLAALKRELSRRTITL
jgi:RNA polymerase sigma factor (sigma-70 family)